MRRDTAEWIKKAEGDFQTALREAAVVDLPNYDAVCFHSQQCVEKYLKAILVESGVPFPRTHDLLALLSLALPAFPGGAHIRSEVAELAPYAVDVRYPGESADAEEAKAALEQCEKARAAVRHTFQLDP